MRIISIIKITTILITLTSCTKPAYCECKGIPSKVDFDKLEDCADKVKEDIMLDMPSDQISIDYIQQVSYEMCEHGFYEGKGRDSKKHYPKSEQ
jgi:hypothetical protein